MPHATDGSISYATMIERYNSDLANTLGNLVNRTVAMANKYFGGVLPCNTARTELDAAFEKDVLSALPAMEAAFSEFKIADALEAVMNVAKRSNKYIDETAPWALAKNESDRDRLSTVLYNLLEAIRIAGVELSPFMPETAQKIFAQINTDITSYDSILTFGAYPLGVQVGAPVPLFARIDAPALLAEIEAEMNKKAEEARRKNEIEGVARIGIEDFAKVDLRAAEIVACEPVKKAKKLLKLTLNDGAGTRTVASGIAKWYAPEDLIGKKVILVSNLKPAVLCGVESQGMILAADCGEDDVRVVFLDAETPAGAKIR
jgi:methionyl-tRNA synthetase